jgi:hypothetical protein
MFNLRKEFKRHFVKDLLPNTIDLLFVLESPHIAEVSTGVPLAGSSGIIVTEVLKMALGLMDNCTPFGVLIRDNLQNYKIGIMNSSPIPLQWDAYKDMNPASRKFVKTLETIRKNAVPRTQKTKYGTAKEINRVIDLIRFNLKRRINRAPITANTIVILCGDFSKIIWPACTDLRVKKLHELPHPSRGQWFEPKNISKVLELKRLARMAKTPEGGNL